MEWTDTLNSGISMEEANEVSGNVENVASSNEKQSTSLPKTGGVDGIWFILTGASTILVGSCIARRKKKNK